MIMYMTLTTFADIFDHCFLTAAACFTVICSSSHLSAILAHVGLPTHHSPDVVIQASIKYDTKGHLVT